MTELSEGTIEYGIGNFLMEFYLESVEMSADSDMDFIVSIWQTPTSTRTPISEISPTPTQTSNLVQDILSTLIPNPALVLNVNTKVVY